MKWNWSQLHGRHFMEVAINSKGLHLAASGAEMRAGLWTTSSYTNVLDLQEDIHLVFMCSVNPEASLDLPAITLSSVFYACISSVSVPHTYKWKKER